MSFDVAADAYDRFMGGWSRGLARAMVELAGVRSGDRVLDVGCGTGMLTLELAARLGADSVAAVDPSESFVAAVRSRAPGVDVRRAAAEELPFADHAFDASLAQLVVHFMADPVAGLTEMARVTRTGGACAASVWDYSGGHGPLGPFWEAARDLDPDVRGEADLAGAREGHLAKLFGAAGLREIVETTLEARREYATFEDWWEPFTRRVGPAGTHVAALEPDRRTELRERCRSMLPPAPFVLTARAWAVRGVA